MFPKGRCQKHPEGGRGPDFLEGTVQYDQNWGGRDEPHLFEVPSFTKAIFEIGRRTLFTKEKIAPCADFVSNFTVI